MHIKFTVWGNPKPQSRPRFYKRGNFVGVYDKDKPDKENFAEMAKANEPDAPITDDIMLQVKFYIKRPKNHFRTGKYSGVLKDTAPIFHSKKPDIDNLAKFVMDSLNGTFWKDDSQVFRLSATKFYSEEPRTEISIYK